MATAGTTKDGRACDMESEIVQIKRYPNRRFYDRTRRKYITLQEIEDLVCRGSTIDVRDSRNDEDLTRLVLTQILVERHPERMEMFPIALLHTILRANDLALEFLRVFLRLSLATLESFQGSRTLEGPRTLPPFVSPFDWMRMFFPGLAPGPRPTDVAPEATVEQLSRRVAELEDRLRQLESEAHQPPGQTPVPGLPGRPVRGIENRGSR